MYEPIAGPFSPASVSVHIFHQTGAVNTIIANATIASIAIDFASTAFATIAIARIAIALIFVYKAIAIIAIAMNPALVASAPCPTKFFTKQSLSLQFSFAKGLFTRHAIKASAQCFHVVNTCF